MVLQTNESIVKWKTKATVFTDYFGTSENAFKLYKVLHPEDHSSGVGDIILMTIESHLMNQPCNDLGFLVGNKLIILVEHQSTWSENIVVRVLLYVIQTWHKYIKQHKLDVYAEKKIRLPEPELYVIYTGKDAEKKPETISLKDSFFGGKNVNIDCTVKVITNGEKGDVIWQYIRFCHVLNEQIHVHGRTRKAIEETIRICMNEDVLREYLKKEREEVIDMMLTLFDEETMMENHDANVERRGRQKEKDKMIQSFLEQGVDSSIIAKAAGVSIEYVEKIRQNALQMI